ncbi:hypothetical protein [Streptomyces sp. NPDC049555]|uniref:hypothetical protein n=1 Tax=Streptomyces sp. NPDC049555 TaxID=3154930 RepID=UPI00342622C6
MTDDANRMAPAAAEAPFGYGLSEQSGAVVHILAEPWRATFWPGAPNSLWAEDREPRHGMSAWALCGHAVQWKTEPPSSPRRPCRACHMPAEQRALLMTSVHPITERSPR